MSGAIKQQIAAMQRKLAKMEVEPKTSNKKKKRNRRRAPRRTGVVAPSTQIVNSRLKVGNRGGGFTVAKSEPLNMTVKCSGAGVAYTDYKDIEINTMKYLHQLAGSFEEYRWNYCRYYWKPMVGTTTNGCIAYGIDYRSKLEGSALTRDSIIALSPSVAHAVWIDTQARPIGVPNDQLNTRKWYIIDAGDQIDQGPGRLCFNATSSSTEELGQLWCSYSVTFRGTRTA